MPLPSMKPMDEDQKKWKKTSDNWWSSESSESSDSLNYSTYSAYSVYNLGYGPLVPYLHAPRPTSKETRVYLGPKPSSKEKWGQHQHAKFSQKRSAESADNDEDDGLVRQPSDDYELVRVEEDDHDKLIKQTREVLQRHRGEASHRARRSSRNSRNRGGKRAKTRCQQVDQVDDNCENISLDVRSLRFSQESCKETFQCGRSVSQLIKSLWYGTTKLSAPFLRLTVFETIDEKTRERILRCIDNRRLYALKEYAKLCDDSGALMVNVKLFSQNTLTQVQRFIQNSDDTDGRDVRLRKNKNNNKRRRPA